MLHIVPFPQPYHPFLQALVIIKMTLQSPNWIFWFILAQILLHWPQRFQFTDVLRRDQRVPHGGRQENAAGGDSWNDILPHDCMIQKATYTSLSMSIKFYFHPSPHLCYNVTYTLWSPVCKVVPVAPRNTPIKLTGSEIKHVIKKSSA